MIPGLKIYVGPEEQLDSWAFGLLENEVGKCELYYGRQDNPCTAIDCQSGML
jgi:hypothetical protein